MLLSVSLPPFVQFRWKIRIGYQNWKFYIFPRIDIVSRFIETDMFYIIVERIFPFARNFNKTTPRLFCNVWRRERDK